MKKYLSILLSEEAPKQKMEKIAQREEMKFKANMLQLQVELEEKKSELDSLRNSQELNFKKILLAIMEVKELEAAYSYALEEFTSLFSEE